MHATDLHDGWSLEATGGPVPEAVSGRSVPATVPGTTHTDLLAADLIPDPYIGLNETAVAWMHRARWRYERELVVAPAEPDERVDLVFEGLDTVATVSLGGQVLGHTANQHRTFRFDVRESAASSGGARMPLTVDFASALESAEAEVARIGARPAAYDYPLGMVRKMACSFGWDWGPDLQTAGIWRPVRLERWRTARLASVRPLVTVTDALDAAQVQVHADLERSGLGASNEPIVVRARLARPNGEVIEGVATAAPGTSSAVVVIDVPEPELWWPVGYGEPALHDLEVEIGTKGAGSPVLDQWRRRIGLRSVRVDTSDDEVGTAFVLAVNATPVFVKGANWIPDDHLLTRITRVQLSRRIGQALGANLNLLRVWGGGIYESEEFYELCDEAGIMVWQDFLLACAAYPEEEPHRSEFEAEAREHVARLTAHPSLVLWNGGNENLWGFMDWGWQEELQGRTWGHYYYTELFPAIVAELAPTTPYADGSPYSPRAALDVIHPNDPDHGTHHQWEVWNRIDYTQYRNEIPRFCSEFGFQGPPAWQTMERAMTGADGLVATKNDPVWLLHQKADDGNGKLDRGLAPHLGVPDDFVDWHWATQLNQARAVAHALTHYRSWWPRTAGAIVWQLNDCWPVTSWAAVDGDEIVKPLWWAMRSSFADRLLTVQTRPDPATGEPVPVLAAVNDAGSPWSGEVRLRRESLGGAVLAETSLVLEVPPRSVQLLGLPPELGTPDVRAAEVLVAEASLGAGATSGSAALVREVHCWAPDIELTLHPDAATVDVEAVSDGYRVTVVAARGLVKDLILFVDRLDPDATVDQALVTLPAGASTTIHVRSAVSGLEAALATAPVLRTANDLARARAGTERPAMV
ncbi:beta-mannosidase [Humibacillus sp. DSM 29435]|uniref:glycoside hydrolase family 2 protein n=1 Tax=Humibacillus sp. DSM 29435 TaxID=1869167 RepID=UPI000872B417|nr:glycoside hydrolase family 2 protein [Humibacillus sp. DSM 29435]OFE17506.1 beta-mannosidase [Humibacillus sp. DSM 29435]